MASISFADGHKERPLSRWITIFSALLLLSLTASAQITINTEAQASFSDGRTPLWLNANKYGLSSLDHTNGYPHRY